METTRSFANVIAGEEEERNSFNRDRGDWFMIDAEKIDSLSREELLELNKIYAKNWLAHDGLYLFIL